MSKPSAVATGASSGIGLELAAIRGQARFDLLVAADRLGMAVGGRPVEELCMCDGAIGL